ncbi:MAG: magnesium chelatase ATPase subunit D [Gammaproteobacteria bacterium]|nr:MAG: magnesium chelatase ATPase subunit D [Gammaproteobacteria bacterium]
MLRFTEIVGMDLARQAMLMLAVDPALGGVVVPAAVGSGKSTLARAFADLLPADCPFVELPLNVTEDRLIGGIDLEATLARGQRVVQRGLLAQADGGVLYIDAISLLDAGAVSQVVDAMSRGEVLVEREGLSEVHPARFMLVGTWDPGDGDVRMGLLDRVGLIVPLTGQGDWRARREIVSTVLAAARRGDGAEANSADEHDVGLALLREQLAAARTRLTDLELTSEQLEALVSAALSLGVEGNRADIFAARAARAAAALAGRDEVAEQDLETAIKLVLMPRATSVPDCEDDTSSPPETQAAGQESGDEGATPPEASADDTPDAATDRGADTLPEAADASPEDTPPASPPETADTAGPPDLLEDLLLEAEATEMPEDILTVSVAQRARSRAGSRGEALNSRRGRFVRARPGTAREGRIALIPTLLAAAPWQDSRREDAAARGRTLRTGLLIRGEDLRIRQFRDKSGTLFVFLVDASGSMALNRMRQAKGAVASLLQNAYVHRDQVALIAFRGQRAEVLLPPSQSVDRAKRELDVLPTGGGTPLASALHQGLEVARQARSRGISQVTFILITDGRGNIGLSQATDPSAPRPERAALEAEVAALAAATAGAGIATVVVDTQAKYLSRGEAERLAGQLQGRYFYLPNARAEQIVEAALG